MTTWGLGDYQRMARHLSPAAARTIELAAIEAGEGVLDVATGTGNAALLAAKHGAHVTGVDFEPALLELARGRAEDESLAIDWRVADMTRLPLPDAFADVVISVFGAMYAADHQAAAAELSRVTRAGGRVALAAWLPGSFLPTLGQVLAPFLPSPPAASQPPSLWGDAQYLHGLLNANAFAVSHDEIAHLEMAVPDAASGASLLIETAGHVIAERARLTEQGRWHELHEAMIRFVGDHADRTSGGLLIKLAYRVAIAERR
ncbi:MAG: class I SAM-dependent methyltransferase [Solirubrobacteraceae bacterium]